MSKIAYLIDDINYKGGAHVAAISLLQELIKLGHKVTLVSLVEPTDRVKCLLPNVKHLVIYRNKFHIGRVVESLFSRFKIVRRFAFMYDLSGKLRRFLNIHDVVCVGSELSVLRCLASKLKAPTVQYVHTDLAYCYSSGLRESSKEKDDLRYIKNYNVTAVVGKPCAERLKDHFHSYADKIVSFHNILNVIAKENVDRSDKGEKVKIVTLSRLNWGPQKKTDAIIRVAARLKAAGVKIDWTIYGGGPSDHRERLLKLAEELCVLDVVKMPGYTPNPHGELAKADLSVMLSDFEGLSNGIYEAMMLGVPVFSTKVGGAEEQIEDGVNGWLVENDEDTIFEKLSAVLSNRDTIRSAREALKAYHYDNDKALREHLAILGIEG